MTDHAAIVATDVASTESSRPLRWRDYLTAGLLGCAAVVTVAWCAFLAWLLIKFLALTFG